jgi:PAP2 superfamily
MLKNTFLCFTILLFNSGVSQIKDSVVYNTQDFKLKNGEIFTYKKPRLFEPIVSIPKDVAGSAIDMTKTNNLIALGAATFSTTALVPVDEYFIDKSRDIGKKLNFKEVARYSNFGPISIIPTDTSSAIYLIGNGATPLIMSMGFATFGLLKNDYRALNTASGLAEGIIVTGVFSQTIKRVTGRQSPTPAYEQGTGNGDWNMFPSFATYAKDTPNYDAMPSGHMMTATTTLYILAENYPDKKWIKPVGWSLIGILGFQMAQSKVHWVSDYPIALVMGYIIGRNIANNKIEKSGLAKTPKKFSFRWSANRFESFNMIGANIKF